MGFSSISSIDELMMERLNPPPPMRKSINEEEVEMQTITTYEINVTALQSFVYERDMQGRDLPAPISGETTAAAAEIVADQPDWRYDLEEVGPAFAHLIEQIVAALPSDRALDTSYLLSDGEHIRSWRSRLARDLVQTIDWQVGHADEAESFAADELIAAHRACDETEIALQRIETAETRVRQAEARAIWWREARAAVVARLQATGYPVVHMKSAAGIQDDLALAIREFQNGLGSPTRSFLAHRILWGVVRIADRGIRSVQKRQARAGRSREAARDCAVQARAYTYIREAAAAAYELATGDTITNAGEKSDDSRRHAETAAWLAENKRRARAFAA